MQRTANLANYQRKNAMDFVFLADISYLCSVIHFSAYDRTYRVYVSSEQMER